MKTTKWFNKGFSAYELIDAGGGKKFERWGEVYTIRPEVQAYFKSGESFEKWRVRNPLVFEEHNGTKGKWLSPETSWQITYNSLTFNLETTKFKHIGIFPEQQLNWAFIEANLNPNQRFLNLFAYTGAASIVARSTGAEVVHVDSVKQLISWAKKNMTDSGLEGIKWVHEDALKFAQREVKRGNKYHGIVMDPPAWGIGANGEKWKIEDKISSLIETAYALLEKDGFLILNTYSPRVSLEEITTKALNHFSDRKIEVGELWSETTSGKQLFHGHLLRARR